MQAACTRQTFRKRTLDSGNTHVTISKMFKLQGYIDENGTKRFAKWFKTLNGIAAAKVTIALTRLERGNLSKVKGVGGGVLDARLISAPASASIR